MADVIHLLPDSVANQIAAGEVIQRPASVVKELVENALDAGANEITVRIRHAGKTLIQVVDNGIGMSETDARLSFERHATSKIKKADDLFSLRTMGFRGEALASIAAIAQVTMKTRPEGSKLGSLLMVEGSQVKRQERVVCQEGTFIEVKNIFFNIPARRAFLKSNLVEMRHIVDEFQYLALAHADKSFTFIHDEKTIHTLVQGNLKQRIIALFGRSYGEQLATCREDTTSLTIHGYIGKPEAAKRTRGNQYLFVNTRYTKSNYINHAVVNAFEGLLPEGSYPFYVLFLEIDPSQIDVNVHPTKTEIKFEDERTIYTVIRATVKKALGIHNLTPTIDFKTDINILEKTVDGMKSTQHRPLAPQSGGSYKRSNEWQKLFEQEPQSGTHDPAAQTVQRGSAVNQKESASSPVERNVFQLHNTYILREIEKGLLIVDQHAAHERILYEKYLSSLKACTGDSQQVLFPKVVEFDPNDFALIMGSAETIKSFGFCFEAFGKNAISVTGVPPGVFGKEKEVFEGFTEEIKINKPELSHPLKERMARSLAGKTAIQPGKELDKQEMDAIIQELFSNNIPNVSVHGKSIFFILGTSKIRQFFNPQKPLNA